VVSAIMPAGVAVVEARKKLAHWCPEPMRQQDRFWQEAAQIDVRSCGLRSLAEMGRIETPRRSSPLPLRRDILSVG
jgi:hypothetical protein